MYISCVCMCVCMCQQLSMERDRLRTSLNRTMEENKKVVRDGDEQLEQITKQSEKRARYIHVHMTYTHLQCT